jgi:hypothetical protein
MVETRSKMVVTQSKPSNFLESEINYTTQKSSGGTAFLPDLWGRTVSVFESIYALEPVGELRIIDLLHCLTNDLRGHKAPSRVLTLLSSAKKIAAEVKIEDDKEKKKKLKESMPAFTPHGRVDTRSSKIPHKGYCASGWVQIDFDGKDNPRLTPEELKRHVSSWPFVGYCGYSVSGNGVWGLSPVFDNLEATSVAIKKYALKEGIIVDSSKGKAEVELRILSFDPEPWFNLQPEFVPIVLEDPMPIKRKEPSNLTSSSSKEEVLKQLLYSLNSAPEGARHTQRLKIGRLAGGYVGGGLFTEQEITQALISNYQQNFSFDSPTTQKKEIHCITEGIKNGMQSPLYPKVVAYAIPFDQIEENIDVIRFKQRGRSYTIGVEELIEKKEGLLYITSITYNRLNPTPRKHKYLTKKILPP